MECDPRRVRVRNNVAFRFPAPFVQFSQVDGILATSGAAWFCDMLKRVPALEVKDDLCQENWGVVVLVTRKENHFWVGLSLGSDGTDGAWLAHFHHAPFAWLQRLRSSG